MTSEPTDLRDLAQRHGSSPETGIDCGPVASSRVSISKTALENPILHYLPSWADRRNSKTCKKEPGIFLFFSIKKYFYELGNGFYIKNR